MIYFDYAATSIKRREIFEDILNNFNEYNANPDSLHKLGRSANKILEDSRQKLSKVLNLSSKSIIFNSGASEGNNTIIKHFNALGYRILCTRADHPSVLNTLDKLNANVEYIEICKDGRINLTDLEKKLGENNSQGFSYEKTLLILTLVNNESGTVQDLDRISQILKDREVWLHIDNVQGFGHMDFDFSRCDSMAISGHKIGGINGFGLLYLKDDIQNLIYGGQQEKQRRGGTSFVMGAYTMAKSYDKIVSERPLVKEIKEGFIRDLKKNEIPFEINGTLEHSSDHILNLYFPFAKSDLLLTYLDMKGICASAGSACSAGSLEESHVITAMYDKERAMNSIRFSFGFTNTMEDVKYTIKTIKELYDRKVGEED
ncbi:cysteine desulfurase family protein [Lagierella sp.]|uniref:cysteine desulfurase family protein n=1 Tax=Lagierella sp. TaxID=2849657 RepID=UPI002631C4D8|nr:cysteine desulfurase family protein [Lagierella sp.]